MNKIFTVLAICWSISSFAAPAIFQDGSFQYNDVKVQLAWFDGNWRMTGQDRKSILPISGYPVQQPELFSLDGTLKLNAGAGSVNIQETIRMTQENMIYSASLAATKKMPYRAVSLIFTLPIDKFGGKELSADGKRVLLSAKNKNVQYPSLKDISSLLIPLPDGKCMNLEGKFSCYIQDERNYGGTAYTLRIAGTKFAENPPSFRWNLKISGIDTGIVSSGKKPSISTIDIRKSVNMGWRDEKPGDRKGGWTDQGVNDVRDLEPGLQQYFEVPFALIDPAENNGKSCMIFAGPSRDYMLPNALIDNINQKGKRLYLLHGLGWAPNDIRKIAEIAVNYTDGSKHIIPVKSNIDVCDWWRRTRASNALMAWRGRNPEATTALYLSGFDLDPEKTVKSLVLTPVRNSVWMVAAVSIGDPVSALRPQIRRKLNAGKDWRAVENTFKIEKDSALDFSHLNQKPAGKFGWVKAAGEHFEFEKLPGKAIRFYGTNLCWSSNFMDKKQAEELAERFDRLGYNSIRIHHYDSALTERNGGRFDLERLDRLDYLIAQLKKHGIYVTIDLFTTRVPAAKDIPGIRVRDMNDFRGALPVVPAVRANLKAFAETLLTHKNPYTGLEWRNDPAIFAICTINENHLPAPWKEHPQLPAIYRSEFTKWCKANGYPVPKEFDDSPLFGKFIIHLQKDLYRDFSEFLKNELGVRALLTDNNNGSTLSHIPERNMLDYVDNHIYWEHPDFIETPWKLPHYYPQSSALKENIQVPGGLMPSRILGKPFMITEIDYCFPNHQRSEGGLILGAYAGLQNWSGIYRFAYSHFRTAMFKPERCDMFDTVRDPLNLFADRIATLMFRRFDVEPAKKSIPFVYTANDPAGFAAFPESYYKLGMISKIGSVYIDRDFPKDKNIDLAIAMPSPRKSISGIREILPADKTLWKKLIEKKVVDSSDSGIYHSDNGQLAIDTKKGTLRIISPRTEGFVLPAGQDGSGDLLNVRNNRNFVTCALTAIDGSTLKDSKKMLLFVLTDIMNSGITFRDEENTVLENYGTLPLLLRKGSLDISIKCGTEKELKVYALDMTGKRILEFPAKRTGSSWHFRFDNDLKTKYPVFCCELERIGGQL